MEEKEEKKQEDLSPEIEKKIKKRKGYSTVLAHIARDLRKQHIKKTAELSKKKRPTFIKRFLKFLGWREKEVTTIESEIEDKKQNDI